MSPRHHRGDGIYRRRRCCPGGSADGRRGARCAMLQALIDGSGTPGRRAGEVGLGRERRHRQRPPAAHWVAGGLVSVQVIRTPPLLRAPADRCGWPPSRRCRAGSRRRWRRVSLRQSSAAAAMAEARSCYDHLASRPGGHRPARHPAGVRPAGERRRNPRLAAHRPRAPLPRGIRTRSRSRDPAIAANAGHGTASTGRKGKPHLAGVSFPRLCSPASSTSAGSTAAGTTAASPSPISAARTCPPSGGCPPPASSRAQPADQSSRHPRRRDHEDNGPLSTAGCTQRSIILAGGAAARH